MPKNVFEVVPLATNRHEAQLVALSDVTRIREEEEGIDGNARYTPRQSIVSLQERLERFARSPPDQLDVTVQTFFT